MGTLASKEGSGGLCVHREPDNLEPALEQLTAFTRF